MKQIPLFNSLPEYIIRAMVFLFIYIFFLKILKSHNYFFFLLVLNNI